MAIGAGIGASIGFATETTFNTAVTVTNFLEMTSENIQYNKKTSIGMGLRAGGQLPRSQRRVVTTKDASGEIMLDLPTKGGLGYLLSYAMGGTVQASGTYILGDVYAHSFTTQVGVPQYGGTVTPKTISGCKVSSFELDVANGGLATGKFVIDGASFTTATSLATPSYPVSGSIFHFAQGAITVAGSSVANIKDFTLTVDNVLKTDRYNLGSTGTKSEQIIGGFRAITGKLTAEFTDTSLFTKYINDTETAIVLTLTGPGVSTLSITVSAAKFDADTANVPGPGVVDLAMTFTAYDNGSDAPLTIVFTPEV